MIKIFSGILWLLYASQAQAFNAAFFYGSPFPHELSIYDAVIVEADHADFPHVPDALQNKLYAYTSLGEVGPDKPYAPDVPAAAKVARNPAWSSDVMDQTSPAWREFFLQKIIAPLWQRGFRGVFVDTLDSYQLAALSPQARAAQESGMVETLSQMRKLYPGMRMILNRGFEILPQVHDWVTAVVAESLFQSWDGYTHHYVPVKAADRQWLLGQLNKIKTDFHLPVIVIDYTAPQDRALARDVAQKIRAAGFQPWVSNTELDMIGVGYPEIQPRRILMLYNGTDTRDVIFSDLHRFAAMPVQYLGFVPEYRDISQPLPAYPLVGQYAGIILWADGAQSNALALAPWLLQQIKQGMRLAVVNEFGFEMSNDNLQAFGLSVKDSVQANSVEVVTKDRMIGFEHSTQVLPYLADIVTASKDSKPILRLNIAGQTSDVAALTPWGGYVLAPYAIFQLRTQDTTSWIINPFEFFKRTLNLPDMPAPDVTTSTGRRRLMAHMDGDGFASNAEFPGSPLAARVMMDKIFKKFTIPTAVSVIEAETAPWGLYPQKSVEMEQVAREIFALPHVEIASHSYSHPFKWQKLSEEGDGEGFNLPLPGYKFDLNKEISGSVDYINRRLAPAGKSCKILLWTGDCNPGEDAVAKTEEAGLLNMNGGDTLITNSQPSLTIVAPLGVARDGHYQVYAPNQNENVYTNLWTGPYYGFRRVIETYKLTDAPRRLKPVDIYFHTYAASKPASLKALDEVYSWALKQPNHPIYPSAYIRSVLDFNSMVAAREGNDWLFYGNGAVDTLRLNSAWGYPGSASTSAGYTDYNDVRYLHLRAAPVQRIALVAKPLNREYLVDANGTLLEWRQQSQQTFMTFDANVVLDFTLHHAPACRLFEANGTQLHADKRKADSFHYQTRNAGQASFKLDCTAGR